MMKRLVLLLAALALAAPIGAADAGGDGELKLVVILTRHNVRSPLKAPEKLADLAAQPWAPWSVGPAVQNAHGNQNTAAMGDYYRAWLLKEGLLSGDPEKDAPFVYVRADNDQRTIETGRILGKALVPVGEIDVHALAKDVKDPLYRPYEAHVGSPDLSLALASVLGRIGGDAKLLDRTYAKQFDELKAVLFGPAGAPAPGSPLATPTQVTAGTGKNLVSTSGALLAAEEASDALLLEYTEGMPMADVGWGRLDEKTLTDILALHELSFNLWERTRYVAQVNGSNLASHLLDTLEQGATGEVVPGAEGPVGAKVVVLVGHDSNIAAIGGLLGLDWVVDGSQFDATYPGGALVFELRHKGGVPGTYSIRASYVTETLGQLREGGALSLEHPPFVAPLFIPGCSGSQPGYDGTLAAFVRQARHAIDPAFVAPESSGGGVPPPSTDN